MRTHDPNVTDGALTPAQLVEKAKLMTGLTATVATFKSSVHEPSNVTAGAKPDADMECLGTRFDPERTKARAV